MKIGIVGLPNVGKSTLFNALTKSYQAAAENFPFCTIEPNTGIVNVADPRLDTLAKLVEAKKVVPATVEFVDIAGLVAGAAAGEGLGNKFLAHIREVDAIVQVVRGFASADVHHVAGSIDPKRDKEIINLELILADLETLNKKEAELSPKARSGNKEAVAKLASIAALKPHLEAGNLAISHADYASHAEAIQDFHLLTAKPFVYAVNLAESDLGTPMGELRTLLDEPTAPIVAISASLEMQMIGFAPVERAEYLQVLGIAESPVDTLIQVAYRTLGLQYYFTAGEIEARAWSIPVGATAVEAAGVIHTDFMKKFIKAEVVSYEDFVAFGGWVGAREKWKVRLEGKEAIITDGMVIYFKIWG